MCSIMFIILTAKQQLDYNYSNYSVPQDKIALFNWHGCLSIVTAHFMDNVIRRKPAGNVATPEIATSSKFEIIWSDTCGILSRLLSTHFADMDSNFHDLKSDLPPWRLILLIEMPFLMAINRFWINMKKIFTIVTSC